MLVTINHISAVVNKGRLEESDFYPGNVHFMVVAPRNQ
jgi:hypothetical protein